MCIFKAFLLLNEYGDHHFVFQNINYFEKNNQWAKFEGKYMNSSISR